MHERISLYTQLLIKRLTFPLEKESLCSFVFAKEIKFTSRCFLVRLLIRWLKYRSSDRCVFSELFYKKRKWSMVLPQQYQCCTIISMRFWRQDSPCFYLLSNKDLMIFFNNKILKIRDKISELLPSIGVESMTGFNILETTHRSGINLDFISKILKKH